MQKKKFKYLKISKDNTVNVLTPVPYIAHGLNNVTGDDLNNRLYDLNQKVMFLYEILRVLRITKKEAVIKEYTLNKITGDALYSVAINKEISFTIRKLISDFKW